LRTSIGFIRLAADVQSHQNQSDMHVPTQQQWKHPSVRRFAADRDPVELMLGTAADAALNAMQDGWSGPPFDPFKLAEIRHISVVPNGEILDARTVPLSQGRVQIEYNPSRPRARIRYSVAHEVAHTFFSDCATEVRNRAARSEYQPHEWELEMLCNLGAAEILMPTGSLAEYTDKALSIRDVLDLRRKFEVSTESVLLRLIRVTHQPYTMFVASRVPSSQPRYKIDYSISSRAGSGCPPRHALLPRHTIVSSCTAMGYVATSEEDWPGVGRLHIECVGVSPYPGHLYPRVIGILRPAQIRNSSVASVRFVTGDATNPNGAEQLIVAHVVNDATPNWGAGFGRVVQQKWPEAQQAFKEWWCKPQRRNLGEVFCSKINKRLSVCQMICQHGYGPSDRPRLRYAALRDCLVGLRDQALEEKGSVHMPRIGTGQAGGSWTLVSALLDEVLCAAGVPVTIYDLPTTGKAPAAARSLFDRSQ
jgi:O-acetyl-ADP-ribose deacetylase (regulator of RNase III)